VRRTRDALDLPDLPAQRDNVRGVPDELERGRLVETVGDDGEGGERPRAFGPLAPSGTR
jgi:hypothetical protein